MHKLLLVFFLFLTQISGAQSYLSNQSPPYTELIDEYKKIASNSPHAVLIEMGKSDQGKPIHVLILSENGIGSLEELNREKKALVMINNGIHPGESCGIDAALALSKKLADPKSKIHQEMKNLVVLVVPVYNVGGMLNRGSFSRANQNGPEAYGFRGNANNLDLNRDFIKCDSRNAAAFNRFFSAWDPDVFVDTHTTNGSDHQYTLTLIPSQLDKMNPVLADFMKAKMLPALYQSMSNRKMEMTPYIYSMYKSPDQGVKAFLETPRFSSGYANLFSTYSFITEAHVFKPYAARVLQTEAFLSELLKFSSSNQSSIRSSRIKARELESKQKTFALQWGLDSSQFEEINFKGYQYETRTSELTGQKIGHYNQNKKTESTIRHYNAYSETASAERPKYYLVPQSQTKVLDRLRWNQVQMIPLLKDSLLKVSVYYIEDFTSPQKPYEGHYLHRNVSLRKEDQSLQLYAGDYLVSTQQKNIRYIIETLEPQGVDSYFAWNFMDANMQQKEWFSSYAFEAKAKQILAENEVLRKEFENKKAAESDFAEDGFAQLYFIYKRSPYYEKTAFRYPIFKVY